MLPFDPPARRGMTEATVERAGARRRVKWGALLGLLSVVGAVAIYAANAAHYAEMPLRIEENEWPPMAHAIAESGKPIIEYSDGDHRVRFNPDLTVDRSPLVGAWHPPLYQYSLAAVAVVAGDSTSNGLRAVGAIGLLAAVALLLLISREVTPRWRLIGGVAAGLLIVHPYAIQGSVFLDIDNTIFAPLALLAMWLAIRFARQPGPLSATQVLGLGGALALVTWAKMTTTIALVGVLVVWWLLSRRPLRRAAIEAASFVGAGAALFVSTYAAWSMATGIPFSYTFDVTFAQKSGRLFGEWWITDHAAHWHLRWFGAAVLLLSAVYLIDLVRNLVASRRARPLDLLFLFGVGVLFNYVLASPTDGAYQGKYAFPALAALLLPVVWLLLRKPHGRASAWQWAGAAALGVMAAALMPDVLTNLSLYGHYGTWSFELAVVIGTGAALGAAWLLGRIDGDRRGFAGGTLLVVAILLVAQDVRSYRSDTSPLYPIPDTADFRVAATDLNASLGSREVVVAPKDLGFYVDGPVIEGEDAFARGDELLAAAMHRHSRIAAVAQGTFGPPIGPATTAVMDKCFLDRRVIGSVTIAYRDRDCG
ncbi:MAG: hypothetical protein GXY03_13735 [Solirubrobacterales bacterium]|nr:hypothetical protein [Solirubrobacterales bacterium]